MPSNESLGAYSFCTFFDSGFYTRGVALIESLRNHGEINEILVVCMDEESKLLLEPLSISLNIRITAVENLVSNFPELAHAKGNRSAIEFYFTCTPFVIRHALGGKPPNHLVVYLDADLYFFDSPEKVIAEIEGASVAIVPHSYPWYLKSLEPKYGKFNVGLLGFRNDREGKKSVERWSNQCIEWCHDYPENGKYADQGYLNEFPGTVGGLKIIDTPGTNLAPWNTSSYYLKVKEGQVLVNGNPLGFFHFHGLKDSNGAWVSSQLNYLSPLSHSVFENVYRPYVNHLRIIGDKQKALKVPIGAIKRFSPGLRGHLARFFRAIFQVLSLVSGQAVRDTKDFR